MRRTGVPSRASASCATILLDIVARAAAAPCATAAGRRPAAGRGCGRSGSWSPPESASIWRSGSSRCSPSSAGNTSRETPRRSGARRGSRPAAAPARSRCPRAAMRVARRLKRSRSRQHAEEARVEQVAALREHGRPGWCRSIRACRRPAARRLHRERHVGAARLHAQLGEQRDQARVGALVEDQEAGVDAVRRVDVAVGARQRDVDGVGVAAEVVAGLEQRDVGRVAQRVGGGQPGDAGADDGDRGPAARSRSRPPRRKIKMLRSAPKRRREGGRRRRIASGFQPDDGRPEGFAT